MIGAHFTIFCNSCSRKGCRIEPDKTSRQSTLQFLKITYCTNDTKFELSNALRTLQEQMVVALGMVKNIDTQYLTNKLLDKNNDSISFRKFIMYTMLLREFEKLALVGLNELKLT